MQPQLPKQQSIMVPTNAWYDLLLEEAAWLILHFREYLHHV
jgi:hypothetical protein